MSSILDTMTPEEHYKLTRMVKHKMINSIVDAVEWLHNTRTKIYREDIINEFDKLIEWFKGSRLNIQEFDKYYKYLQIRKDLIIEMLLEFKVFKCRIYPSVMKNVIKRTFNMYKNSP